MHRIWTFWIMMDLKIAPLVQKLRWFCQIGWWSCIGKGLLSTGLPRKKEKRKNKKLDIWRCRWWSVNCAIQFYLVINLFSSFSLFMVLFIWITIQPKKNYIMQFMYFHNFCLVIYLLANQLVFFAALLFVYFRYRSTAVVGNLVWEI